MVITYYKRTSYKALSARLKEGHRFIQVLVGPRQTGKTTLARQLLEEESSRRHYATADEPALKDLAWIEQEWQTSRQGDLLILDEIQKIPGWSETVKRLWDEDTASGLPLRVLILGSSALLMEQDLTESLAGRFEVIPVTHWSFPEMKQAFGWDLDRYIFFGGYPGAAPLIDDPPRWSRYIIDSLIETTLSRDILLMRRVDKPALLRRLFDLGCAYSGRVLSYQKMIGQLQDAGNTTTLAHYLGLLDAAGLLGGLPKYAGQQVRRRASSPKLQVLNTALMTASSGRTFEEAKKDREFWGRLVESAIGAALANGVRGTGIGLYYWASGNREVDFVLERGKRLVAIEVKSAVPRRPARGLEAFGREFPVTKNLLVGEGGIPLEVFLGASPERWVE